METQDQPKLRFHGVDIVKVDFSSKSRYEPEKQSLKIHTDAKVFFPKENPKLFNILMDVSVDAPEFFHFRIFAIGAFECSEEIDENIRKNFINVNAPAIMFPYIRSFITTFTSNLGNVTHPIIIPVRFFKGDMEEILLDESVSKKISTD